MCKNTKYYALENIFIHPNQQSLNPFTDVICFVNTVNAPFMPIKF